MNLVVKSFIKIKNLGTFPNTIRLDKHEFHLMISLLIQLYLFLGRPEIQGFTLKLKPSANYLNLRFIRPFVRSFLGLYMTVFKLSVTSSLCTPSISSNDCVNKLNKASLDLRIVMHDYKTRIRK